MRSTIKLTVEGIPPEGLATRARRFPAGGVGGSATFGPGRYRPGARREGGSGKSTGGEFYTIIFLALTLGFANDLWVENPWSAVDSPSIPSAPGEKALISSSNVTRNHLLLNKIAQQADRANRS